MLIPVTCVVAELAALSVAVPLADWFVPSAFRTTSLPHSWIPDSASVQLKRTRTALLNQPAMLAARAEPSSLTVLLLIVGAVRSILTPLTEPVPELPALSLMEAGPAPRLLP